MKPGYLRWGAIAIATALVVAMAPSDSETGGASGARPGNRPSGGLANADNQRTREAGHVELYRLARLELLRKEKRSVGDAFKNSWDAPRPPPVRPVQPVELPPPPPVVIPTAPPIPFTYLGRYGDTASRTIILAKGEKVYTVSVGDVIENTYRIERFSAGMINLTYLPLSIEQHLPTGEAL